MVSALLDPEGVIKLLREQRDSDLAMLVVLAAVAGPEEENPWRVAAERLEAAVPRLRAMNPRRPQGKRRGTGPARDVLAYIENAELALALPHRAADTAERAAKIAERAAGMLRQVAEKGADHRESPEARKARGLEPIRPARRRRRRADAPTGVGEKPPGPVGSPESSGGVP